MKAPTKVVVIQGHPDARETHFCHALADAYASAAQQNGHDVSRIEIARIDFPLLRSAADWETPLPPALEKAQDALRWADHVVLVFPLWQGTMPALVKAFFEQVLRPGFGYTLSACAGKGWRKGLSGKSARLIVPMGMPAFFYRWYFFAHGVKGLERSILKFCGISPVRETLIGRVENETVRRRALEKVQALGHNAR